MSLISPENLTFIRQIPFIGSRLYESLYSIQQGINAIAVQGNLNPTGQVEPPPAIQSVTATGGNGVLHVSIEHTAADVKRGVVYHVEHADNPSFINPQIRNIGDSRSHSEYIGSQARYVRAYASYPGSPSGPILYHGGATPEPVDGGGSAGPAPYLPSQGSGTGAAGQGGVGPGPVPIRTDVSGYDWRLQRPIASESLSRASSPGSQNGVGSIDGGSGGGGGLVVSEAAIAACEWLGGVAGTNTITATTANAYQSLSQGFLIRMLPANTNSGATTLNVNSIGAKAVTKNGTSALVGGELVAGKAYLLLYDGTRFQIVGIVAPISATVLASDTHGVPSVAALPDTHIWIGSGGNLPVDKAISGDATLADTGVLTLANTAVTPSTYGDAANVVQFTVDSKGRLTFAQNVPISYPGTSGLSATIPLAKLTIAGANGSVTFVNGLATGAVNPT